MKFEEIIEKYAKGNLSHSSAVGRVGDFEDVYQRVMLYSELYKIAEAKKDWGAASLFNKMIVSIALDDIDELTGLPKRRSMESHFCKANSRLKRYGAPFSLAMIDIDNFKNVNDGYGHLVGDIVLKNFAGRLSENVRDIDGLYRFGGEEFVALYSGVGLENAFGVVDALRINSCSSPIPIGKGKNLPVSFSAGVYCVGKDDCLEDAIERADKALYKAKDEGRDRVVLYE